MKRQHRITVLKYAKGNIWLLIVPLVRSVFLLKGDFEKWYNMVYMDIFVILLVFGAAWLKWYCTQFEFGKKELYVKKGVLISKEIKLPYSRISCRVFHRPFLFRPFKVMKIYVETDACSASQLRKKSDVALIVSEIDYTQISQNMPIEILKASENYCASKKEIFLFSICFSSALPGLVYLGTVLIQGRRIVGEKSKDVFISVVNELTEAVEKIDGNAEESASIFLLTIAAGWLVSFAIKMIRYIHFKISKFGKNILIENGYFSSWKYIVNYSRINTVDIRQNLLMKITRTMSVHINCSGYGRRKNELALFIPITTKRRAINMIERMLPNFTPSNIRLKVKRTYIMAYIWLPLLLAIVVALLTALVVKLNYEWADIVKFIGVMAEIPLVYLLIVRVAAKMSTGIGASDDSVTVSYCRAIRFHTVVVPKERISYIKIRRTLLQRASGCCDVIIYARGGHTRGHKVRGMVYAEALLLVENWRKMCQNAHL